MLVFFLWHVKYFIPCSCVLVVFFLIFCFFLVCKIFFVYLLLSRVYTNHSKCILNSTKYLIIRNEIWFQLKNCVLILRFFFTWHILRNWYFVFTQNYYSFEKKLYFLGDVRFGVIYQCYTFCNNKNKRIRNWDKFRDNAKITDDWKSSEKSTVFFFVLLYTKNGSESLVFFSLCGTFYYMKNSSNLFKCSQFKKKESIVFTNERRKTTEVLEKTDWEKKRPIKLC